ncbi:MAG: hypothetical protein R6V19_08385 [Armatimonadota bacterium]
MSSTQERSPKSRRLLAAVLVALAVISLATTAGLVFNSTVQAKWSVNADSQAIARNAMEADWSDIGSWWTRPWIQHEMYYRPLASMLFFLQGQVFGMNFQGYCIVSWIANTINVLLLCLLGASLARGSDRVRIGVGVLAGLLFLWAKHPGGVDWSIARVTWGVMPWWPVQTDIFSLMFSLLSLLLLDRYLQSRRRGLLVVALASFVAALLFKEMALAVPLMVPALVWYRSRKDVLRLSAAYLGIGVIFYVVRSLAAPAASGLEYAGNFTFLQYAFYVANRLTSLLMAGELVPVVTSAGIIAIVIVALWRRLEWIWTGLIMLLWLLGSAQLVGGNFALITILDTWARIGTMLLFWGGLVVLALSKDRGVSLPLLVCVLVVFIPVVNRVGPHYWYWPLAIYALLNASLLNRLREIHHEGNDALVFPLLPEPDPMDNETAATDE